MADVCTTNKMEVVTPNSCIRVVSRQRGVYERGDAIIFRAISRTRNVHPAGEYLTSQVIVWQKNS